MNMTSYDIYQRIFKALDCKTDAELEKKLGMNGNINKFKSKTALSLNLLEKLMATEYCTEAVARYVLTGDSNTGDQETIRQIVRLTSQVEVLQDTLIKSKIK